MKRYTTNDMLLLAWLTTFAALCSPVAALLPEAPKPLKQMPATSFTCAGKVVGGYYADVQAGCRVFHVCTLNEKGGTLDIPFLCVDGTVFDQKTRVCERVDEVDCSISESFYHLNNELYGPGIIPMTALLRRPSSASPRPREEAAAAPARVSARRPTRPRLRGRQEEGRERQPVVGRRPSSRRAVITRLSPTRQPSRARTNITPAQNAVDLPFRREFGPPNVPAAVQDFGDAAPFEVTRPVHRTRPRRPSPSFDSDVVVDRSPLVPEATFVGADPDPPAPPQETTTQAPTPAPIVLPVTSFSCEGRVHGGLYADPEAGCELYHVCSLGPEGKMEDHRFLCGAGTLFDQVNRICRAANEVNCAHATDFYHLNSNPLQAVILSATDFPEHQFDFPRVRQRRADEVLSTNQYLCALLGQNEASGDPAVRCAYYFLCNTHYVQQFKQCENDLSQSGSRCLSQEAVECMNEISGYQEAPYGVPEALRHLKGPIGRRRRSALPSMANLVVVPGTEDARVRRALFSLAALQLWVKENAMHSSFIDMQTIQMKNGPFVKKVESTTGSAPESKIRVLTRLRRQLSDVRDSGDSSLPQASGDATLSIENTTTSSTVAPTTTISTTTTSASPKTTPITPSPEPQVTTEDVPVTSLGPADEQLDVFAFTTLPTLTKVTTPTTPPITTVKVDTLSSISPTTISTPAQDPSVTEETSTSVPSSTQSLLSVMQDSTPSFVDTTTAVSQAKSSSTQLPETSTSNDLPVEKKDQIDEAVDDARQEETPTLTTSTTSSTSTTSTLATMSSLPSTSATPVNMIPPINKASSEVTTVKSQETSPVSDTDQSHTGENDTKAKNTTDPPLTSSVKNTTEPLDGTSNSTEPTPSPGSNRYENVTDQDGVWNETSSPTPKPGQLFTRDNLPETSFTCKDKQLQKFYPDPEVNCQVFHYCSPGFTTDQVLDLKFLCTGPTMFDVKTQKCEDMEQVTCSKAELPPKEECNVTEADKLGDGGPATCDNKTSALPSSVDQNATAITENVTSSASNTTEMPDLSIGSVSTNASAAMVTLDNVTLPHDSSSNASIPSSENIIHNETTDGHVHNDTSADSASESNVTVKSSPHNETSDGGDSIQRNTFKSDVVLSTEAHSNDSSHNATKVDDDSIHDTTSSSADAQGELTDVGNSKQDTSSSTDFEEASSSVVEPSQETTPVNDTETKIPPLVPLSSEAPQGLLTSTPSNTETPPSTTSQHALTTEPNLKVTSPPSAEDGNLTEATNRVDPILTSDTVQVQEATEEVHDKKETQPATEQVSAESSKKGSASVELATTIEESVDPANETGSGNETNTTPSPSTPSEPEKNTMLAAHPNDPQGPEEASDSGHESKLQLNVPTTTPSANTSEELKSDLPSDAVLDSTIKVDSQNDTGSVVAGHEGQEASAPSPQPDNTRETVPELSQVDPTGEGQDKNSDKAKEQETISGSTSSGGSETVAGGASPEAPAPTPATAAESS